MTDKAKALNALLDYDQADEDGIIVLASRQAIHEVFDYTQALEAERDRYKKALKAIYKWGDAETVAERSVKRIARAALGEKEK